MATRYGSDVLESVWALACQLTDNGRIPRAEIRRRLASQDSPLGRSVDIPKRTLDDILTRLITDRGDPQASISPSEIDPALDAIQVEAIGALRKHVRDIRRTQKARTLTPNEISSLTKAGNAAQELARRRKQNPGKSQILRDNGNTTAGSPSILTSQLRKALDHVEERGGTEASEHADREHEARQAKHERPRHPGATPRTRPALPVA